MTFCTRISVGLIQRRFAGPQASGVIATGSPAGSRLHSNTTAFSVILQTWIALGL